MATQFAKRHYEAIALVMQEAATHVRCDAIEQNKCVVNLLADLFASDNHLFNRERFKAACQPYANVKLRTRYRVAS